MKTEPVTIIDNLDTPITEETPIPTEEIIEPTSINEEPKVLYTVRVTYPSLRMRSAPSFSGQEMGLITDQGLYEIINESDGWGQLKNGYWILLRYTSVKHK